MVHHFQGEETVGLRASVRGPVQHPDICREPPHVRDLRQRHDGHVIRSYEAREGEVISYYLQWCFRFRIYRGTARIHLDVCEHSPDPSIEGEATEEDGDGKSAPAE